MMSFGSRAVSYGCAVLARGQPLMLSHRISPPLRLVHEVVYYRRIFCSYILYQSHTSDHCNILAFAQQLHNEFESGSTPVHATDATRDSRCAPLGTLPRPSAHLLSSTLSTHLLGCVSSSLVASRPLLSHNTGSACSHIIVRYVSTMSQPALKRPRVAFDDDFERKILLNHPTLYYDDGNVILRSKSTLFRVHRSILYKNSPVFRELFERREDTQPETLRGCMHIALDDSKEEVEALLNVIYDGL